jgi:thioredoxin 1
MSNIIDITDADFEQQVLNAEGLVLVDFWATWCGPCKVIAPVLEDLAKTYQGKVTICKLNVEDSTETPAKYDVRNIPKLILFKNGKQEDSRTGALPKGELEAFINAHL